MASPIVESLCCVPLSSDLTQYFLSTFRTVQYNVVCLIASIFGILGATWQLSVLQASRPSTGPLRNQRPRFIRTNGSLIVRWLAVSDLCAASGIALRSALWLWDSAALTGGLEPEDVSPGRLICVAIASWIHYFYTCTYIWTCLYCVDCVRGMRGVRASTVGYHALAWLLPAALTFTGLLGLYAPDLKCHSSSNNPYIRFLPNYLSTVLPLLVVLVVCPALYCHAAHSLHTVMAALTGRYTGTERNIVRGVQRRFFLLCCVFWLCWLPNVVNAALLWLGWDNLPYTVLTGLWYTMAVLNPLQAVFNSFVYPSQSARSTHRSLGPAPRSPKTLPYWLLQLLTCGLWAWLRKRSKARGSGMADTDCTRDTDLVDYDEYEELSSSEYQSASSSPRTLGSRSPVDDRSSLLTSSKGGSTHTPFSTRL